MLIKASHMAILHWVGYCKGPVLFLLAERAQGVYPGDVFHRGLQCHSLGTVCHSLGTLSTK